MKTNIKLLQDNRLVGTHVHRLGDVVEMDAEKAKEWLKAGRGAMTNEPPTPIPVPVPRFPRNQEPVTLSAVCPEVELDEPAPEQPQKRGERKSKRSNVR